jgi:hypothetical protein
MSLHISVLQLIAEPSATPASALPADLPGAQVKSGRAHAAKQHDGQITQNLSRPLAKNISLSLSGKSVV